MIGNDISPQAFRPKLNDFRIALALLTRLPFPYVELSPDDPRPPAHAAWAYPLVGLVVGTVVALVVWSALAMGLPGPLAAILAVLAGVLCTGAMHEDGLADCADGFWGGWSRDRRLEIMKDSQIGAYGMIALVASLSLRAVALTLLLEAGGWFAALLGAGVVSRAAMVWTMHWLPNARKSGLSHHTGRPPQQAALLALALGVLALVLLPSVPLFSGLIAVVTMTLVTSAVARAKVGGQTGDVLGGTQQVIEITVLLTCLAAAT